MTIHINIKERALVDSKTGEIYRPQCFDDLYVYIAYLESTKRKKEAICILKRIIKGERVISDMINKAQHIPHNSH